MKKFLLLAYLVLMALTANAQTDLGNRALRGSAVWILDSKGFIIIANLDTATLVLDPPGTAGGRPTLRAITPAAPPTAQVRQKTVTYSYAGGIITLDDTPLPGAKPLFFWSKLLQPDTAFSINGKAITLGPEWQVGDLVTFVYLY